MHILVDAGLKVAQRPPPRNTRSALSVCISFNRALVPQLLHLSIKKSKVSSSEESALEMLDPFISLLLDCLDSMHVKVGACTLFFYYYYCY